MTPRTPMFQCLAGMMLAGLALLAFAPAAGAGAGPELDAALRGLQRTLDKAARDGGGNSDLARLQAQWPALEAAALQEFADVQTLFQASPLPEAVRQRHPQAVAEFRARMQALRGDMDTVGAAKNPAERQAAAGKALQRLNQLRPAHLPPGPLPFQGTQARPVPEEQAGTGEWTAPPTRVAGAYLPASLLAAAPALDDLALGQGALSDTPDIRELARRLEYNPVKIYSWAHDNIGFAPTFGATQSAQTTLLERRGNALDTASLLIALLRASGIHARYAYGDAVIAADTVVNWLGVENTAAAVDLLSRTGIPLTLRVQGGQVVAFKFRNHVWAEAWIDFVPSRGAVHRQGDTWVALDASFKQYQAVAGTPSLSQAVPFDAESFRRQLLATMQGDANQAGGVDLPYIQSQLADYQNRLSAYADSHETRLPRRQIVSENRTLLAAVLPYAVAQRLGQFSHIPEGFDHTLSFRLYADAAAQSLDTPVLAHTFSLYQLDSARLSLSYDPATPDDAQALSYFQQQGSLPLYLVRLKPVLRLDGQIIAEGPAAGMGQAQYFNLTLSDPDNRYSKNGRLTVGDEVAFVADGNGVGARRVQARLNAVNPDSPAENLHQTGLHYWMEHDLFNEMVAQAYGARQQRLPSAGLFAAPLTVDYRLGIPYAGYYETRHMDVHFSRVAAQAADAAARLRYLSHIGLQASYLEGNIFDQLFGQGRAPAVSTAQVLLEAARQNIPIYRLAAQNLATVLPQLALSPEDAADITALVNAGRQVVVPQAELSIGAWRGTGYIAQDAQTGDAAYVISGGWNGGTWKGCEIRQIKPLHNFFSAFIPKNILMGDFVAKMAKLAAQLLLPKTAADSIGQQIDNAVRELVMGLVAIVQTTGWNISQVFAVEGTNCLAPGGLIIGLAGPEASGLRVVAASADEHADTEFITNRPIYGYVEANERKTVYFRPFPVGGVACSNYHWTFHEIDRGGTEGAATEFDGGDRGVEAVFPPGHYRAEARANCPADAAETILGQIDIYLLPGTLIPDYDRDGIITKDEMPSGFDANTDYDNNGKIDADDRKKFREDNPFYFWVNNDGDYQDEIPGKEQYDAGAQDIPIAGNSFFSPANWNNYTVDGVRDLIDFFPVWVNIGEILDNYLSADDYSFVIKQKDAANILDAPTGLSPTAAKDYLIHTAIANPLTKPGVLVHSLALEDSLFSNSSPYLLPREFIASIGQNGIILLEGRTVSKEPLTLEILNDKKETVFEIEMPISLDTPENMYRHIELRNVIHENGKIEGNYTEIPQNYPEEMSNDKNLIFIHGYKVGAPDGIGWLSEIFKRFYWSGSNARFYGVSWSGDADNGKILPAPYQKNIANAFKTAPHLATALASIQGDKILAAHSAGNMVASHAIVNHGLNVQKYFMLNAAVPVEAYDESAVCNQPYLPTTGTCGALARNPNWNEPDWLGGQPNPMVAWPDWLGQATGMAYLPATWSANYYPLFAGTADVRSQLTWRRLFQDERLLSIAYNFYSAGEAWYSVRGDEVFELHPTLDWGLGTGALTDFARHAWQKQESCKGENCTGSGLTGGTPYAGWGFYTKKETSGDPPVTVTKPFYSVSEANSLTPDTLKAAPVFRRNPPEIFGNPQTLTKADLEATALETREAVLAMAIPALSPAAGGAVINRLGDNNINLDKVPGLRNGWPSRNNNEGWKYEDRWLHTDLKDVAYLYTYPFYWKMVELGELDTQPLVTKPQ